METDAAVFLNAFEIDGLSPCATLFKTLALAVISERTGVLRGNELTAAADGRKYTAYF